MPKKSKNTFNEYDLFKNETGFMEVEEGEGTDQHIIQQHVDITSATKHFDLTLDKFGPYKIDYSLNGRHLLMGGAKGHLAAFDWQTKKLLCEINVMETIHDVKWLHRETMYAVAQKQWTYIYDNNGIELHCLKMLDSVQRMEFLPYHFLLATCSSKSYLSWLDVSLGKMVGGVATGLGRLDVMTHNPQNAICVLGHSAGTVSMWSPNVKESLVKMLCHVGGVVAVAVNKEGTYMATAGTESKLKIWDLRTYKLLSSSYFPSTPSRPTNQFTPILRNVPDSSDAPVLNSYSSNPSANRNIPYYAGPAHCLAFSQTGLLAVGMSGGVSVYNNPTTGDRVNLKKPYLSHPLKLPGVGGVRFCPYEDVLGVGHSLGFTSLLVPGAGQSDYDGLEHNPYESKKQSKEAEVKRLLNKIQPELISLDTSLLCKMEKKSAAEVMEAKIKGKFPKGPKRDRSKLGKGGKKGRRGGGGGKSEVEERKHRKNMVKRSTEEGGGGGGKEVKPSKNPLDRFKKKKRYTES